MKEQFTTVTRKGQITLPAEIRRSLGIQEGDKVAVSLVEGEVAWVAVRPVKSVAEMTFGSIAPRKQPEDFQELRESFEAAAARASDAENAPDQEL